MALLFPTNLCRGRSVSRPVSLTVPHNHVGLRHEVPLASEESLAETGEATSQPLSREWSGLIPFVHGVRASCS